MNVNDQLAPQVAYVTQCSRFSNLSKLLQPLQLLYLRSINKITYVCKFVMYLKI